MSSGENGRLAGRYRVVRQLGRGGMGVVWQAVDEVLGREVAVKELRTYTDTPAAELAAMRLRMQREARAAARVRHSGVVAVHDVTEHEGRPVIVMELVDGRSLDDILADHGPLDPAEAARIGARVLEALAAAHAAGVLHRDVKPGNILLERSGRVVLTDFGIAALEDPADGASARLTASGDIIGSLDFLSPERAQGAPPAPAADVWALGATLYAAVEGTTPFRRTSTWSTLAAIVTDPLPPPTRAGRLGPVLALLLAKDPQARPDAAEAARLVDAVAEAASGGAPDGGALGGAVGGAFGPPGAGPAFGPGAADGSGAFGAGSGAPGGSGPYGVAAPLAGVAEAGPPGGPEAYGAGPGTGNAGNGAGAYGPGPNAGGPGASASAAAPSGAGAAGQSHAGAYGPGPYAYGGGFGVAPAHPVSAGAAGAQPGGQGRSSAEPGSYGGPYGTGQPAPVTGTGSGRADTRATARPRRRGLVAAAVAGVVLVGGGVSYALMDRTTADQAAGGGQRSAGTASGEPGRVLDDLAGSARPTSGKTPGPGDSSRPGDAGSASAATPSGPSAEGGGATASAGTEPSTRAGGGASRSPGAKPATVAPTTAAPPPPATSGGCTASGSSATCQVVRTATSTRYDGGEMGTVAPGPQLFYCQVDLDHSATYGGRSSRWWARTDDDSGNTNVYVSVLHLSGGAGGGPVDGLRIC
ncbi:serine/threonine-protein kinase [Streptomyces sp. NPDC004267]|uniref:serine/threonine-protein kinase n=1 Tax=Streptomyces sp. NPDC004267 TaxID=3364694 RepID=UPI0036C37FC9